MSLGPVETTGLVVVAVGLVRVVERLIDRKTSNGETRHKLVCLLGQESEGFRVMRQLIEKMTPMASEIHELHQEHGSQSKVADEVHSLYKAHAVLDDDGIPMVYMPRSWGKTQEAILEELRKLNRNMDRYVNGKAK